VPVRAQAPSLPCDSAPAFSEVLRGWGSLTRKAQAGPLCDSGAEGDLLSRPLTCQTAELLPGRNAWPRAQAGLLSDSDDEDESIYYPLR